MFPQNAKGFSLVEVMIAIGITGLVAGAVFMLLEGSMNSHAKGHDNSLSIASFSRSMMAIRGDIGRSNSTSHATSDSLLLVMPSGNQVSYSSFVDGDDLMVFRWENDGGGWKRSPGRALSTLKTVLGDSPSLSFTENADSSISTQLVGGGSTLEFSSRKWAGQ